MASRSLVGKSETDRVVTTQSYIALHLAGRTCFQQQAALRGVVASLGETRCPNLNFTMPYHVPLAILFLNFNAEASVSWTRTATPPSSSRITFRPKSATLMLASAAPPCPSTTAVKENPISVPENLEILTKPIAVLVVACVISTLFVGPAATLMWVALAISIYVALHIR